MFARPSVRKDRRRRDRDAGEAQAQPVGLKRVPIVRTRLHLYKCLDGSHVPMTRTSVADYPAPAVPKRTYHGSVSGWNRFSDWPADSTCTCTPTGYSCHGKETQR